MAYGNHECSWWGAVVVLVQDIWNIVEYLNDEEPSFPWQLPTGPDCGPDFVFGSACLGHPTLSVYNGTLYANPPAPGFKVVFDGDFGNSDGRGFWHQEYVNGVTDASVSARFNLPRGSTCGLHHTRNSPGKTCMGFDPAAGQCPAGWVARGGFDMSSDYGYWVWCEYQDPNNLGTGGSWSATVPAGLACGVSHDDGGSPGYCLGIDTRNPNGLANCPASMFRSGFYDDGRSSGRGLGWCAVTGDYQGCYTDAPTRALPSYLGNEKTIEGCLAQAKAAGFPYAGLQWYGECWAGFAPGYQRVSDAECNTPCHQNGGETCGGAWRNSIYATH
jgi:hypothetical protein